MIPKFDFGAVDTRVLCFLLVLSAAFALLLAWLARRGLFSAGLDAPKDRHRLYIGIGLAVEIVLACLVFGHPTDMRNFSAWAVHAANVGLPDFYGSIWADYPPGYIHVLYLLGKIGQVLGVGYGHPVFNLIIKLPAILCDAACGYFIYRVAREKLETRVAANLCGLYVLNPMIILDSAVWGQVDSVFTLMCLLMFQFYIKDKKPLVAVMFVIGVFTKPQMLMFGPILLAVYIFDIVRNPKRELVAFGASLLAAAAAAAAIVLPYGLKNPEWVLDNYVYAAGLYPYATTHAFNLYALLNANWTPDKNIMFLNVTYKMFGLCSIAALCAAAAWLYLKRRQRPFLFAIAAFLVWGIYLLGPNMHDRYLYPAIAFLMIAYAFYNERSLLYSAIIATGVVFANSIISIVYLSAALPYAVMAIVSIANLAGFVYMTKSIVKQSTPVIHARLRYKGDRKPKKHQR